MAVNLPDNGTELFRRIAENDETAFRRLFETYRIPLFSFAFEMTKSAIDAEDIVQEVFVKIWDNRQRLATLDKPIPYVYAMTRNQVFDFLHMIARNEQMVNQVWANSQVNLDAADMSLLLKESGQLINQAVKQLSPVKREIFRMSREEGLSHKQIAEKMGLSGSRVKNIIVECLKFIRDYLARYSVPLAVYFWCYYGSSFGA